MVSCVSMLISLIAAILCALFATFILVLATVNVPAVREKIGSAPRLVLIIFGAAGYILAALFVVFAFTGSNDSPSPSVTVTNTLDTSVESAEATTVKIGGVNHDLSINDQKLKDRQDFPLEEGLGEYPVSVEVNATLSEGTSLTCKSTENATIDFQQDRQTFQALWHQNDDGTCTAELRPANQAAEKK